MRFYTGVPDPAHDAPWSRFWTGKTATMGRAYDVGLLFSQDQDFSEVAREIRTIAREQDRWIKLACAFPVGPGNGNQRGVDHTDWIGIDRSLYERCVDPRDYRLPS